MRHRGGKSLTLESGIERREKVVSQFERRLKEASLAKLAVPQRKSPVAADSEEFHGLAIQGEKSCKESGYLVEGRERVISRKKKNSA